MPGPRPVSPRLRRRYVVVLRPILAAAGVALALLAVAHYSRGLSSEFGRLQLPWLVPSLLAAVLAAVAVMLGWRALLRALGHEVTAGAAARIFFVSQIGKYLPGSIWPYLAQVDMAREVGVPAVTMGAAGLMSVVVSLVTAGVTAAVVLPFVAAGSLHRYWPALLVLLPLVALLHPVVLRRATLLLRRGARRPGPVPALAARRMIAPTGWWLAGWVCYGVHLWAIARALGVHEARALPLAVGGFALAWLVGFLVVVSPAGAGAREAVLIVVLTPVLTANGALVVALVSRLMTTVVDIVAAAAAAGAARLRRPASRRPIAAPDTEGVQGLAGAGPLARADRIGPLP